MLRIVRSDSFSCYKYMIPLIHIQIIALLSISLFHNPFPKKKKKILIIYRDNDLVCFAPKVLKGMLEIRGIGIVDVGLLYGASSVLDACNLDLVIALQPFDEDKEYNRLSINDLKFELFGLEKPLLEVPVKAGRAMSVIVEAAVINHRLRQKGIDSGEVLRQRVIEDIQRKGGQQ